MLSEIVEKSASASKMLGRKILEFNFNFSFVFSSISSASNWDDLAVLIFKKDPKPSLVCPCLKCPEIIPPVCRFHRDFKEKDFKRSLSNC